MAGPRRLPNEPIAFIRECARAGRVLWTYHVNLRLKGRFVSREFILNAVDSYELVEAYPGDKYLPSPWCWRANRATPSMCSSRPTLKETTSESSPPIDLARTNGTMT